MRVRMNSAILSLAMNSLNPGRRLRRPPLFRCGALGWREPVPSALHMMCSYPQVCSARMRAGAYITYDTNSFCQHLGAHAIENDPRRGAGSRGPAYNVLAASYVSLGREVPAWILPP